MRQLHIYIVNQTTRITNVKITNSDKNVLDTPAIDKKILDAPNIYAIPYFSKQFKFSILMLIFEYLYFQMKIALMFPSEF